MQLMTMHELRVVLQSDMCSVIKAVVIAERQPGPEYRIFQ